MQSTKDELRFSRESLAAALRMAGAEINGSAVHCPFHDDRSASGSIHQDEAGIWRYTCHGPTCGVSGDVYDIQSRGSGLTVAQVLKAAQRGGQGPGLKPPVRSAGNGTERSRNSKIYKTLEEYYGCIAGTLETEYRYKCPVSGSVLLIVCRIRGVDGKKTFRQLHSVDGGFIAESPEKPWPLYNQGGIAASDVVLVVEGEKCAEAAIGAGVCATTSPCGAGKAEHADWSPLNGKTVYLWPDNDAPGRAHMDDVERILQGLNIPPTVCRIEPNNLDLGEKQDIADFLASLGPVDRETRFAAIQDALAEAQRSGPAEDVRKHLERIISGDWKPYPWPWPILGSMTRALLPGTVTLICGDPGASKSFLLLQAAGVWYDNGIKFALYELEEDRTYHLYRALAQVTNNSKFFDEDWVQANAEEAREFNRQAQAWIDSFGKSIWAAPNKQMTLDSMAEWIRERAKAGCQIIAVDPITAAVGTDKPWLDDLKFVFDVKTIAREYQVAVVLVTHPKEDRRKSLGLYGIAGGKGYVRFSQTVIWVEDHRTPKRVIIPGYAVDGIAVNRTLHLLKTRNGCGHGVSLAFQFNGGSLCFEEKGVIEGEVEERRK